MARLVLRFVLVGLGIALLGWSDLDPSPRAGLDSGWNAVLHLTAGSDLDWGRDLVFTYGPLGFLKVPVYWEEGTGILAILYALVTRVAFAGALWFFGRRTFGDVGAALVALLVVPFAPSPLPVVVFGWALWLLAGERSRRQWLWFAGGAGAIAGLELLGKVNTGALLVALGAIAVLAAPRDRVRLGGVYAGAFAGGLLLGWVATGQRLLDLNDYLVNSVDIASGYSMSMLFSVDSANWQYSAALILVVLALYGAWTVTPWAWSRARVGALLLTLALAFMGFKSGFVRHDPFHARELFGLLLPALMVIPYPRDRRPFGVAAVAAALLVLIAVSGARLDRIVDPFERVSGGWTDVISVLQPGERDRLRAVARRGLQGHYNLHPDVVGALRGHTVHVEQYETAVAWAYDLELKPPPIFHGYQAYTERLDELNAGALLASDAPSRILVGTQLPVDGRLAGWDPPAAVRAMLCRYQPLVERGGWLVLGRGEDRCGEERPLGSREAPWGELVPVPPQSEEGMVIVRVRGAGPGFSERVRATLYKGHERLAKFDEGGGTSRFIPGTAEDGLVLHVPPGRDWPPGYGRAPGPKMLAVDRAGDPSGTLRYDFSLVPMAP